jgi:hypothetical protein
MPIDPESIRVDLLKMKRKLYISYPEGSQERQDYLYASKLSELTHLQKLVDPQVVDLVFAEYEHRVKTELLNIMLGLGLGACFSVMFFGFHQLHPTNFFLSFYFVPGLVGLYLSATHVLHLVDNYKNFQPFKREFEILNAKIDKLLIELKGFKK